MELVYTRHVTEYAPSKTGEYQSDISQFWKDPSAAKDIWTGG